MPKIEQTELDKFQPPIDTTPIHPYDVYWLITEGPIDRTHEELPHSPRGIDEQDYARNLHKVGDYMRHFGITYHITTTVPFKREVK